MDRGLAPDGSVGPAVGPSRSVGVVLVLGLLAGVAVPALLVAAVWFGNNVPQTEIASDYGVGVLWAAALGATILIWPVESREKALLLVLWIARCGVTLGAMLWYESRYPDLDAYAYFAQAKRLGLDWSALDFGDGTGNLVQLAAFHDTFLVESYHAQKVTFSFLGLIAVYLLYRAIRMLRKRPDLRLLAALGIFPSILFWSSILGKEPIVLLGTAIYVLGVVGWYTRRQTRYMALVVVGVAIAMFIRTWNGPILLLPLLVLFLTAVRQKGRRILLLAAGIAGMAIAMRQLSSQLQLETLEEVLFTADALSQSWAVGGSAQRLNVDFTDPLAVAAFLPRGMFTALFRPVPGEIMNPFGLMAGLENLFLIVLLVLAISRSRLRDLRHPLVLWALALVIVWSAAYAIVSYQNLGTAARFKVQVIPVTVALLAHLARLGWLRRGQARRPVST